MVGWWRWESCSAVPTALKGLLMATKRCDARFKGLERAMEGLSLLNKRQ